MDSFPSIVIIVLVITILFLNRENNSFEKEQLLTRLKEDNTDLFEDLFLSKLQDVSEKTKGLAEHLDFILRKNEEKIGFGSGITTESSEEVAFVSLQNWEDERSPDGVSLQRYQHSFPENWSGEDGVYACYNLDPATSSFTQSSISFLEKIASGLPGYDDLEAVWICGNAGRKRYHFTGTTPNFNILSANSETLDVTIQQQDLDYFQKSFDNARRMSDINIFSVDDGYNLPVCDSSAPTRTANTVDSTGNPMTLDVPKNYFTQVGALTFANFNPDIAEEIFLGEKGPQAWLLIKTFIKEIYNGLFTDALGSGSPYSPPININYKECEIIFVSAPSVGSGSGYGYFNDRFNDQSELVTGLVVHESKSEGITFYYNIDYRFDSSIIPETAIDISFLAATDVMNQVIFNGNVGFTGYERSFDYECQTLLQAFRAIFPEYYATLLRDTRYGDNTELVIRKAFTYVGIQEVSFELDNVNNIQIHENTVLWKVLGDDKDRPCDATPGNCMTVIAVPREYTLHSSQVLKKNEISTVEDEKECCPKTLEQLVQEKKSAVTQMNPTYWMKEGGFDSSTNRWVLEDNSEIPINVVGDVSVHTKIGHGSQRPITALYGSYETKLEIGEFGFVPDPLFTIATICRYTSIENQGRILQGAVDWWHGHAEPAKGSSQPRIGHVYYDGENTDFSTNPIHPSVNMTTDWVIVVGRNGTPENNDVLYNSVVNGVPCGTNNYSEKPYILYVNDGLSGTSVSDFAISEIIMFDSHLSDVKMKRLSDYLQTKLGKINSKGEYYNDVYLPIKDNCKQEGNFMDSESPISESESSSISESTIFVTVTSILSPEDSSRWSFSQFLTTTSAYNEPWLTSDLAWISIDDDISTQFLEVDLQNSRIITGVVTSGWSNNFVNVFDVYVRSDNQSSNVFVQRFNDSRLVEHAEEERYFVFSSPIEARFVKIRPQEKNSTYFAMKFGVIIQESVPAAESAYEERPYKSIDLNADDVGDGIVSIAALVRNSSAYLMFSQTSLRDRGFSLAVNSADKFVFIRFSTELDSWEYNASSGFIQFSLNSTDAIIAEVGFGVIGGVSSVALLQGVDSKLYEATSNEIQYGFSQNEDGSLLQILPNSFNGRNENGEVEILGNAISVWD